MLAKNWLDIYFTGREPDFMPPLHMTGSDFGTTTYGAVAKTLRTCARAIGGAVAHNSIAIIIPCHRVIGANGNLTGYSGGLDKKIKLLELEKIIL